MPLFVHILAGAIALLSGFIALYSVKGAALHRQSGLVFAAAMLVMSILGASIAAFMDKARGSTCRRDY